MALTSIHVIMERASAGGYGEDSETIAKLSSLFLHATWDRTGGPFICGEIGQKTPDGLHEGYMICPCYGADVQAAALFKRATASPKSPV